MSNNLETVKKYFDHCVDGKMVDRVGEYFADDVIVHRPDVPEPIVGVEKFKDALRKNVTDRYETIVTTLSKEVVTDDVVVVALATVRPARMSGMASMSLERTSRGQP